MIRRRTLIMVVFYAACLASVASAAEPIKLGVLVSETGSASWLGGPQINGAKLAIEELNAKGGINGRPVSLVIYNDESSPEKGVIGARKLIEEDKVVAIVGPSVVAVSKAIAPLVKDRGPIAYALTPGYTPENPYMFASSVHTSVQLASIMDWMSVKQLKKVALLATTDSTGQVAAEAIKKVALDHGIAVVATERMNLNDVDVTPQLARIRGTAPDAVITWLTGKPAGVVVKNYAQLGLTYPLFISQGNVSYSFIESIKKFQPKLVLMPCGKDVVWSDLLANDPHRAKNETFHRKYLQVYKQEADLGPPLAYDAIMVIAEAMKKAGTDPAKMKETLEQIRGYTGLIATYNFTKDDHRGTSRQDTVLVQVKDGHFSLYWDKYR